MTKDFLSIADLSRDEIFAVFERTGELKEKLKRGEPHRWLDGKTLAMIFQKPSARTRISFEVGMFQLGGHALYLAPADIGIGKREAVADIGRVLSRYVDLIMARLFGHEDIEELAKYASVPVINGLTDLLHPCQVLGDAFTILERLGRLENVKVAWIGDGNNVANSWLNLASKIALKLDLAVPQGYDPNGEVFDRAQQAGLSRVRIVRDPREAVEDADVIYTDVWASMGQETEAAERRKVFRSFQVNSTLVRNAKPEAIVMHCLPAHRGEEITDDVIDGRQSVVFVEAENRLHVQKAIMVKLMSQ